MRTFGTDSPRFMVFKLGDDETTYRLPLAASMPMTDLLALSDAANKGGAHVLRAQLDLLRKHIGDRAETMTASEVAEVFIAWNEESASDGARVPE